jgi:hypothetical protein
LWPYAILSPTLFLHLIIARMNLEYYQFKIKPSLHDYEFYSKGPNGHIKKVVRFTLILFNGIPIYNLSFGNWKESTNSLDDVAVSNNGDRDIVLQTVVAIVIDFTSLYPDALIYAEGSTPSRTRLYRMGINKMWDEANLLFQIYGVKADDSVELFKGKENYEAFIVRRITQ